jgi:hypothetical protein
VFKQDLFRCIVFFYLFIRVSVYFTLFYVVLTLYSRDHKNVSMNIRFRSITVPAHTVSIVYKIQDNSPVHFHEHAQLEVAKLRAHISFAISICVPIPMEQFDNRWKGFH